MESRKCFLTLTLMVGGIGWANADEAEDRGIAVLESKSGGRVQRDRTRTGSPIVDIDLMHVELSETDLKTLGNMKELTTLSLWRSNVTNGGLKNLASLKKLTSLSLADTKVDDTGLKELAPFQSLNNLDLSGTKVTDAGLKELCATGKPDFVGPRHHQGDKCRHEGTLALEKPDFA